LIGGPTYQSQSTNQTVLPPPRNQTPSPSNAQQKPQDARLAVYTRRPSGPMDHTCASSQRISAPGAGHSRFQLLSQPLAKFATSTMDWICYAGPRTGADRPMYDSCYSILRSVFRGIDPPGIPIPSARIQAPSGASLPVGSPQATPYSFPQLSRGHQQTNSDASIGSVGSAMSHYSNASEPSNASNTSPQLMFGQLLPAPLSPGQATTFPTLQASPQPEERPGSAGQASISQPSWTSAAETKSLSSNSSGWA
jgi:hypothetical protein